MRILWVVLPLALSAGAGAQNTAIFEQALRPIVNKSCVGCHSKANASGGLVAAGLDDLLVGGKHGPAIVPGDAKASLLMQYVRGEQSPKMPMGGTLDTEVIASLAKAIDSMKPLPKAATKRDPYLDWLLKKPVAPVSPVVKDAAWIRNPIDAFVLARLEAKGLAPSPPASKRALLRRVYFDLIGLPPTPQEIDGFESDASSDAYEKVLDKLLGASR